MDSQEVNDRLAELIALPVGWDSYHDDCQPVLLDTAKRAAKLIQEIGVPPDNVVPISASGPGGSWVQVEWYPGHDYVEIEVSPAGDFNYMSALWQGPGYQGKDTYRDSLTFRGAVEAARTALT